jgi:hypothetical protein
LEDTPLFLIHVFPKKHNQNKLRNLVSLRSIWPNVKESIQSQDINSRDLNFNIIKLQKELLSAYKGTLLQTKQIKLKLQTTTYNFYTEKHGNVAIIGQLNYLYSFNFYEKLQELTSSKKNNYDTMVENFLFFWQNLTKSIIIFEIQRKLE